MRWLGVSSMLTLLGCAEAPTEEVGTTNDELTTCKVAGLYRAGYDFSNYTVWDYRRCDTGVYLDGQSVANAIGWQAPSFAKTTAYRVFAPDPAYSNGKLLIYLPGGNGSDLSNKDQILQLAADTGYHVVAVPYWNDDGADITTCGAGPDQSSGAFAPPSSCPLVDGQHCNPYTDVTGTTFDECSIDFYLNNFWNRLPDYPPAFIAQGLLPCSNDSFYIKCAGTTAGRALVNGDAVLYRVRALLTFLTQTRPAAEGWGTFAATGTNYVNAPYLKWQNVALMGHSTGSKVLMHIAHDGAEAFGAPAGTVFDRVIFLSGPNVPFTRSDVFGPLSSAYVTTTGKTPLDRIYAFSNTGDDKVDRAETVWKSLKGPATKGSTQPPQVGLTGLSSSPWAPYPTQTACSGVCRLDCQQIAPATPPSAMRALTYSAPFGGSVGACVGTDIGAHESTTRDESCSDVADPKTCWYRNVWRFMLTN